MPLFPRLVSRCTSAAPRALACTLTIVVAHALHAQVAGVVAPPPAPPKPAPAAVAAATPTTSAAARRDSLALAQRLDIQAWVDSAAGALASGAPATTVPLTAPPPAPARVDSARPLTPRSRRPTPVRRPTSTQRPEDVALLQRRVSFVTRS